MIVTCKQCLLDFNKSDSQIKKTLNNFCSRSCAATFNNKGKQKNPPKLKMCKKCFNIHHRTLKCLDIFKTDNKKIPICNLKISPDKIPGYVRAYNRIWNKNMISLPCCNCGNKHHSELAHIKPISKFESISTLGEINHPDNVIALCPNCHWELDNGFLFVSNEKLIIRTDKIRINKYKK